MLSRKWKAAGEREGEMMRLMGESEEDGELS